MNLRHSISASSYRDIFVVWIYGHIATELGFCDGPNGGQGVATRPKFEKIQTWKAEGGSGFFGEGIKGLRAYNAAQTFVSCLAAPSGSRIALAAWGFYFITVTPDGLYCTALLSVDLSISCITGCGYNTPKTSSGISFRRNSSLCGIFQWHDATFYCLTYSSKFLFCHNIHFMYMAHCFLFTD